MCDGVGSRETVGKLIRAVLSASVLGCVVASLAVSPALCRGRHAAPHRRHAASHHHASTLQGIDVSHYQGAIDWRAVARDGVDFAYVKATEGLESRDPRFAGNWRGAQRAGIRVGAYHYFIFCRSGRAQARNFLAVAPRSAGALPPAVDLEIGSACPTRLTGREMRRELDDFLAVVEAREHRRAVLYVTPQFYATYRAHLPKRPMWRRSILSRPDAAWTFWQYRSTGRVAGIHTPVDLNVYRAGGRRTLALNGASG